MSSTTIDPRPMTHSLTPGTLRETEFDAGAKPHSLLLVEDDNHIRELLRIRLQSAGFKTFESATGSDAGQLAIEKSPAAIVLDIRLPGKSGIEILEELKGNEATKEIPVIVVSASVGDRLLALASGANHFIAKPFDWEEVFSSIRGSIDRVKRSAKQLRFQPLHGCLSPHMLDQNRKSDA